MSINITEIADAVSQVFADYCDDVVNAVNGAAEEVAKACAQDLRQNSPKDSGRYARSWKVKRQRGTGGKTQIWVVYNEKHYRLTHLLERGHLKAGGEDRVRAIPHIEPARDEAEAMFEQKALEAIGRVTG